MDDKLAIKILVLDDDSFMIKLLACMLESFGFLSVSTCDNGHAALELIDRSCAHPDLILLDINMPEMDGVEFVRHLVDHHYSGALILVSGEGERMLQSIEKLVRAHKIAVLGYLTKPVTPERLAALIDKWVAPDQGAAKATKKIYSADELREAIAGDELVNYYQPKVAVSTGEVIGVEALVRWRHPRDGIVFPDQFVSLAEKHRLIDDLTRNVLAGALAQSRIWRDAQMPLRVAVNVSMDNLISLDFLECIVDLTTESGVPPQEVVLEVTESRLMNDLRVPLEILTRLHLRRFRLSIDDFGTGNSSLTQLRNVPFVELKIDQSFVHGAWANDTQRVMFNASHGLANQLQMETVAEGVEDRDDWDFVRQRGCELAQGYFIARPMPAEQLSVWLAEWEDRRRDLMRA